MKFRKGIFIVTYKRKGKKISYLILHRKLHWKGWEFPKAGLEKNENKQQAVIRELKEETGNIAEKITRFNVSGKYKYNKEIKKREKYTGQTYTLFAIKIKGKKVKIDRREHDGYKWTDYEKARQLITYSNQKKCLAIVDMFLNTGKLR